MNYYERKQMEEELAATRDDYIRLLAEEGLRAPDVMDFSWAKWTNGETYVIVRFGLTGKATFDAGWLEEDGHRNGMFAPRDVTYIPWLARDIARMLESPGRKSVVAVGKP